MSIPRLVVSGLSGGAGKTMLSLGLARSFQQAGLAVRAFKKGPDYIDAAWLSLAARAPQANLDPYFTPGDQLKELFVQGSSGYDMAIVEGNRGLFDGLDIEGSCSTAEVSRLIEAPVLLVLDCTKMTRTAAALVRGCRDFEPGVRIGGVVLNRTGNARHQAMARRAVEELAGIPVLGVLPRSETSFIFERHMGLSGLAENADAEASLDALASFLRQNVDLNKIHELARSAAKTPSLDHQARSKPLEPAKGILPAGPPNPKARIGVVLDPAFWFYYRENLEALTHAGALLVPLSLMDTDRWPEIDGLYIGGGLPELYAVQLAGNTAKREYVAMLSRHGLPIYAECGGFMYLAQTLKYKENSYPMAGVFPCGVEFCPKPQGLGYVQATVVGDNPFLKKGTTLRGHEFHFSRSMAITKEAGFQLRLDRGKGMGCRDGQSQPGDGLIIHNTFASYTHIYAPAVPQWAQNFVALISIAKDTKYQSL